MARTKHYYRVHPTSIWWRRNYSTGSYDDSSLQANEAMRRILTFKKAGSSHATPLFILPWVIWEYENYFYQKKGELYSDNFTSDSGYNRSVEGAKNVWGTTRPCVKFYGGLKLTGISVSGSQMKITLTGTTVWRETPYSASILNALKSGFDGFISYDSGTSILISNTFPDVYITIFDIDGYEYPNALFSESEYRNGTIIAYLGNRDGATLQKSYPVHLGYRLGNSSYEYTTGEFNFSLNHVDPEEIGTINFDEKHYGFAITMNGFEPWFTVTPPAEYSAIMKDGYLYYQWQDWKPYFDKEYVTYYIPHIEWFTDNTYSTKYATQTFLQPGQSVGTNVRRLTLANSPLDLPVFRTSTFMLTDYTNHLSQATFKAFTPPNGGWVERGLYSNVTRLFGRTSSNHRYLLEFFDWNLDKILFREEANRLVDWGNVQGSLNNALDYTIAAKINARQLAGLMLHKSTGEYQDAFTQLMADNAGRPEGEQWVWDNVYSVQQNVADEIHFYRVDENNVLKGQNIVQGDNRIILMYGIGTYYWAFDVLKITKVELYDGDMNLIDTFEGETLEQNLWYDSQYPFFWLHNPYANATKAKFYYLAPYHYPPAFFVGDYFTIYKWHGLEAALKYGTRALLPSEYTPINVSGGYLTTTAPVSFILPIPEYSDTETTQLTYLSASTADGFHPETKTINVPKIIGINGWVVFEHATAFEVYEGWFGDDQNPVSNDLGACFAITDYLDGVKIGATEIALPTYTSSLPAIQTLSDGTKYVQFNANDHIPAAALLYKPAIIKSDKLLLQHNWETGLLNPNKLI